LLLLFNAGCLAEKQQITILQVFGLIPTGLEPTVEVSTVVGTYKYI